MQHQEEVEVGKGADGEEAAALTAAAEGEDKEEDGE